MAYARQTKRTTVRKKTNARAKRKRIRRRK